MPRKKRIWVPDSFYHVISRGNRREFLFKDEYDYTIFLQMLASINEKIPFELASYCLMTNHFHLQIRSQNQPISKVMSLLNKRYADYYNTKNGITGHVFEKRFFAKIIYSQEDMLEVSRYIHLNPMEAGMVPRPESYAWSSYQFYLNSKDNYLLEVGTVLDCFSGSVKEKQWQYREFVEEKRDTD
ncbi:REP element-mobilizing transposase RayT [Virgibacillus natechei]|uniref:REP element-mobilizing transposase RayT n=1 Tax=Virgibacillus natechei TaxID=1216297 RepID=A0ABS4ILC3_9BACI|nr:transposase [Virgibacillus natechei]MBP1971091.1 REP element-mobilizing transposase RayT [Virgibacillus natechei]UZD12219.1 transposase [Virgibacillus natechei]